MKAIGVIPARFGSTRFPGKPLERIAGRPLLSWVIEGAKASRKLSEIIVATDDDRIRKLAESCGARGVMTNSELPTGTDRVWQAVRDLDFDVVVNIQGDEPLVEGSLLDRLVEPFLTNTELHMATLGRSLDAESLASANTAKIVLNHLDEALYFSRFPIPYSRNIDPVPAAPLGAALKHIGLYAYRRDFLKRFCETPPTACEMGEGLEQLRALYLGARIRVVRVEHDSWGVDVPADIQKIESLLAARKGPSST